MEKTLIVAACVVSALVIIGLVITLVLCEKNKSNYTGFRHRPNRKSGFVPQSCRNGNVCLCSGSGKAACLNRKEKQKSYLEGNNEYQTFQKPAGWVSTDLSIY